MQQAPQSDRAIKLGLFAVIVLMSWPVWIAFIAAKPYFSWGVAAGGLIPLALTLLLVMAVFDLPKKISHQYHHWTHSLGEHLHGGFHRHA
jgi:uncharacterized membrane protein